MGGYIPPPIQLDPRFVMDNEAIFSFNQLQPQQLQQYQQRYPSPFTYVKPKTPYVPSLWTPPQKEQKENLENKVALRQKVLNLITTFRTTHVIASAESIVSYINNFFGFDSFEQLGLGPFENLPEFSFLQKEQEQILQFIDIYIKLHPVVTLYDLKVAVCSLKGIPVDCKLGLNEFLRIEAVQNFFDLKSLATPLQKIHEIRAVNVFICLYSYLKNNLQRTLSSEDVLTLVTNSLSITFLNVIELGVKIQNVDEYVSFVKSGISGNNDNGERNNIKNDNSSNSDNNHIREEVHNSPQFSEVAVDVGHIETETFTTIESPESPMMQQTEPEPTHTTTATKTEILPEKTKSETLTQNSEKEANTEKSETQTESVVRDIKELFNEVSYEKLRHYLSEFIALVREYGTYNKDLLEKKVLKDLKKLKTMNEIRPYFAFLTLFFGQVVSKGQFRPLDYKLNKVKFVNFLKKNEALFAGFNDLQLIQIAFLANLGINMEADKQEAFEKLAFVISKIFKSTYAPSNYSTYEIPLVSAIDFSYYKASSKNEIIDKLIFKYYPQKLENLVEVPTVEMPRFQYKTTTWVPKQKREKFYYLPQQNSEHKKLKTSPDTDNIDEVPPAIHEQKSETFTTKHHTTTKENTHKEEAQSPTNNNNNTNSNIQETVESTFDFDMNEEIKEDDISLLIENF
eukprot:TRINITY_DN7385_c0_g3_i1.p1 TRINITY_DN7385_c0_g3~~TRINITY_DN7385_c0_g3_i1.p1  ORF type:complete len:693 (+),score=151.79 TRINITY_DN7385_c0_g3_i1:35-2080(+)